LHAYACVRHTGHVGDFKGCAVHVNSRQCAARVWYDIELTDGFTSLWIDYIPCHLHPAGIG